MLAFLSTMVHSTLLAATGAGTIHRFFIPVRTVAPVSITDIAGLAPFALFASATYCDLRQVQEWKCVSCQHIPGFQVIETGGDGDGIQQYFIGYWPEKDAVVVAHEGTNPQKILSDLTDIHAWMRHLNLILFPGVSTTIMVHSGFANEHEKTAQDILAQVNLTLSHTKAKNVFVVGHSLGGALAELDALFLTLNLDPSIHVKGVTFGTPRVGNPAWATLFDFKVPDFTRVNNAKDPVAIVPGRHLGFQHPQGEIHILPSGKAYACPGNDDATDPECTIASEDDRIDLEHVADHLGPYIFSPNVSVTIGTLSCGHPVRATYDHLSTQ
ncbi:Alpha/Beta hydrolase protein [Fomes fomentarius]|nr:Alpha/Beta hydrolase protein [Fomes fomentarius]